MQRCKEVAFDDMVARLLFSQYNASIKNIPVIKMRTRPSIKTIYKGFWKLEKENKENLSFQA